MKDLSWWPKVTTWENSGMDFGCWTPMAERWFRKQLEALKDGRSRACSAKEWYKNLRFQKETKKFLANWNTLGWDFLKVECRMRNL